MESRPTTAAFTAPLASRLGKAPAGAVPRRGRLTCRRTRTVPPRAVLAHGEPVDPKQESRISSNCGVFAVDPSLVDSDPEENLRGFVKTRGSLIPGEVFVFWWTGDIYALVDEAPSRHLFNFEGYNIGRMARVDGGWRLLTREVGLYKDPRTGRILDTWENPHTNVNLPVVHVWNDPVNQQFLARDPAKPEARPFHVPTTRSGDDLYWHAEVFLKYPSPLPKSSFPHMSQSDTYQSAELFQFYTKADDLTLDVPSTPCLISWVRVGQWLPWMDMGDRPGKMVYHCRGKKLDGGYMDLPDVVRAYVEREHPEYASAPTDFTQPNETSWSYYKKLLEQKGAPRADGTVARAESKVEYSAHKLAENPGQLRRFTADELARHNGADDSLPIYISVMGRVFDVTKGKRHYGPGETYNCLTGKDATKDFLTGRLRRRSGSEGAEGETGIHLDALTNEQRSDLENWIAFFGKEYEEVGYFSEWKE